MMSLREISSPSFLIVGGDGLIGSALYSKLDALGEKVIVTTRRQNFLTEYKVKLDLSSDIVVDFSRSVRCAYLCAGITSMIFCESERTFTRLINVERTIFLAKALNECGVKLIFISSSTVFDGVNAVDEYSVACPSTEYGRQKLEVESALLKMNNVAIVRLTKVISSDTGIASAFIRKLLSGHDVEAFEDLTLAPVSLKYVVDSLINVAQSGGAGVFHLSSDFELSYAEMAYHFADRLKISKSRIKPISFLSAGVNVLFNPIHPALGMTRTTKVLGIMPESIDHVYDQLLSVGSNE